MKKMFFNFRKVHRLPEACNFTKKETLIQVFSCGFCKIFKNTFFYKTLPVSASEIGDRWSATLQTPNPLREFHNKLKVNSIPLSAGQVLSDVESSLTFDTRQLATSLPLSLVCRTSGICQPFPKSPIYYRN